MPIYTKRPGFERELSGQAYVDPTLLSQRVRLANPTQFGEVLTASRTPIIELNSAYGPSVLRDQQTVTGSGAITGEATGEILLSTGTTASSSAFIESGEIGRYIPGFGAELGVGIRIPTDPTGNQFAEWGGIGPDNDNGFYFGKDATGFYVAVEKGGVVTKTYRSSWNIDALDGTGPSGYNIDTSDGHIYQIDFTWYGYGQILFGIVGIVPAADGETVIGGYRYHQEFILCHSERPTGGTSVNSPNLRVFARSDNGGDTSDFDVYLGGRQYSIVGQYVPKFRFTGGEIRTGNSITTSGPIPMISFRRKSGFSDRSIRIENFEVINDGTNKIYVEIYLDATLSAGTTTFGTPTNATASETAVESNTGATAMTGGTRIFGPVLVDASATAKGGEARLDVDFDIPNGSIVTLAATALSGTNSVDCTFKLREEW